MSAPSIQVARIGAREVVHVIGDKNGPAGHDMAHAMSDVSDKLPKEPHRILAGMIETGLGQSLSVNVPDSYTSLNFYAKQLKPGLGIS